MHDTSETIEIKASAAKQVSYALLCVLATLAFVEAFEKADDTVGIAVSALAVAIIGAGTVFLVSQYVPRRGTVITISPEGIRDIRIAPEFIPWTAVQTIFPQSSIGNKYLLLSVDREAVEALTIDSVSRRQGFGSDQVPDFETLQISSSGLKVKFSTLRDTCLAYAHRYGAEMKA